MNQEVDVPVLPNQLLIMMGYNPFAFDNKLITGRKIPMRHPTKSILKDIGHSPRMTCGDLTEWAD